MDSIGQDKRLASRLFLGLLRGTAGSLGAIAFTLLFSPAVYAEAELKTIDTASPQYPERFGIETSYRIKNHCRIRTTTKNPVVHLLFVA